MGICPLPSHLDDPVPPCLVLEHLDPGHCGVEGLVRDMDVAAPMAEAGGDRVAVQQGGKGAILFFILQKQF